jgi:hypothetical protein
MTLTNLKTELTKTATVTSVKLAAPADRIGLGFGAGLAYPADSLSSSQSVGRFPTPHNPEPEQVRSRQDKSAALMRMHRRTGVPNTVPPAGSAGCFPPGPRAVRVSWLLTVGANRWAGVTDPSRNRNPKTCVRLRQDRDCQSPVRSDEKHGLSREAVTAAAAGK